MSADLSKTFETIDAICPRNHGGLITTRSSNLTVSSALLKVNDCESLGSTCPLDCPVRQLSQGKLPIDCIKINHIKSD